MSRKEAYRIFITETAKTAERMNIEAVKKALQIIKPYNAAEDMAIDERLHKALQERIAAYEKRMRRKQARHHHLKVEAVAILSVIMLGSAFAYALGYDVWKIIVDWGSEHFMIWVSPVATEESEELDVTAPEDTVAEVWGGEVAKAVASMENPPVLPGWRPAKYKLAYYNETEYGEGSVILAVYEDGNQKSYSLQITEADNASVHSTFKMEVDTQQQEEIVVGEERYYVMTNLERRTITWHTDGAVILIYGDLTQDDVDRLIDSMR